MPRVLGIAAATLATAAFAPVAHAATDVTIDVSPSLMTRISIDTTYLHTRFEVQRAGNRIGSTDTDTLDMPALAAGDAIVIYDGSLLVQSVLYDGLPAIANDACVGGSSFTVQRGANATIAEAGARDELLNVFDGRWSIGLTPAVSLSRPLGANDLVYVQTYSRDGTTSVYASRLKRAMTCAPPVPPPPPLPPTPPSSGPVTAAPQPDLIPSAAGMTAMVRGSLSATGASLRTRTTRRLARSSAVAVPFAFPEAGRVELELRAKNTVIASGARTSTVNGKVIFTVKLTPAAHRLFKRYKKLKVIVKGAFTPSRNGAETSRASSTVTLR